MNYQFLDEENALFYVNMAPSCFLQREASEKYFNRESPLENLLTELAKELAQTLKQTHGGLRLLPNTISNVLKSQACRGKIYDTCIIVSRKVRFTLVVIA